MDPDLARMMQVLFVVGAWGVVTIGLGAAARFVFWRGRSPRLDAPRQSASIDDERMARLEQAVDAIAVEVERISEGQRFTAKLLSERSAEKSLPQ